MITVGWVFAITFALTAAVAVALSPGLSRKHANHGAPGTSNPLGDLLAAQFPAAGELLDARPIGARTSAPASKP